MFSQCMGVYVYVLCVLCASCIIHLHRSGLASATPAPSVPVISVTVARGTIYPTPHCHDILETLFSLSLDFLPRCPILRWRDSLSCSLVFSSWRRVATLSFRRLLSSPFVQRCCCCSLPRHSHTFILFPVTSLFYSLFLRSILRVRESFVREGGKGKGGKVGGARIRSAVEQCHITLTIPRSFESFMRMVIVSQ